MRSLVDRYEAGDRVAVWDELHALESLADAGDTVREAARTVARLTMQRAAANVETIHRRLIALGYVFDEPGTARVPPNAEIADTLRRLVAAAGPVPCSIEAWFEHVGYVFFRGHFAVWTGSSPWKEELLDPIEFTYHWSGIESELEMREEYPDEDDEGDGAFNLDFAGDFFHKNDVSGGGTTHAVLSADTADALIFEDNGAAYTDFVDSEPGDGDGIWFVDYLRRYFRRGGFRRMRPDHVYPVAFWPGLADGLLEI